MTLGTNTSAPALASASENAWPSPVLPPVTMAFLPASEKKSIENSLISIEAGSVGLVTASTRPGSSVVMALAAGARAEV